MKDALPHRSRRSVAAAGAAIAVLALSPRPARALRLLDEPLSLEHASLHEAALHAVQKPAPDPSLDFDLLGKPPPVATQDDASMKLRRKMLSFHQGLGLGLVALELGTTVVGQLNYSDRFGADPPGTARYQASHAALAYGTLGVFAVNGIVALLAPRPKERTYAMDRVMVHRIGMALATAGMIAQGALGVYTHQREGYLDQQRLARTHLAVGYATFAAFGVAVGALVF
jgi:hypothetical protein